MQSPEVIKLSCPNCGARLAVRQGLDEFACAYCGTGILVQRTGNTVALEPILQALGDIHTSLDHNLHESSRSAVELERIRVMHEIATLRQQLEDQRLKVERSTTIGILLCSFAIACFCGSPALGAILVVAGLLFVAISIPLFIVPRRTTAQLNLQIRQKTREIDSLLP